MHTRHQHLVDVELESLRPTQMTVGFEEVAIKRQAWVGLEHDERSHFLSSHWFPGVKGPKDRYFIVDHHHLGLALLEESVSKVKLLLLKDFSVLDTAEFWTVMDHHQWAHSYDAQGRRCAMTDIPSRLQRLADDPYRSLAGAVRRAGGFPKDQQPFAEFLWADFFRHRISAKLLKADPARAQEKALDLAHDRRAAHLPGWSGEHL